MTISDVVPGTDETKLRFLNPKDMPDIVRIEGMSYLFDNVPHCWKEKKFLRCMARRGCVPPSLAVDKNGSPQGFLLYRTRSDSLEINRLTVDPWCRRRGVGTALIQKVISRLTPRRPRITMLVYDGSDEAHHFLKKNGFRCTEVQRNHYEIHGIYRDAYCFEYRLAA